MLLPHDGTLSELSKHWFLQDVGITLQAFPRGVRTRISGQSSSYLATRSLFLCPQPWPLHILTYSMFLPPCMAEKTDSIFTNDPPVWTLPVSYDKVEGKAPLSLCFIGLLFWLIMGEVILDDFWQLFDPSWCSPFIHTHCSVRKCSQSLLWLPYPPDH